MSPKFEIVDTQPAVYLDSTNRVINGVLVRFRLLDYDEVHEVRVPKLDVGTVQAAIDEVLKARDELFKLGAK